MRYTIPMSAETLVPAPPPKGTQYEDTRSREQERNMESPYHGFHARMLLELGGQRAMEETFSGKITREVLPVYAGGNINEQLRGLNTSRLAQASNTECRVEGNYDEAFANWTDGFSRTTQNLGTLLHEQRTGEEWQAIQQFFGGGDLRSFSQKDARVFYTRYRENGQVTKKGITDLIQDYIQRVTGNTSGTLTPEQIQMLRRPSNRKCFEWLARTFGDAQTFQVLGETYDAILGAYEDTEAFVQAANAQTPNGLMRINDLGTTVSASPPGITRTMSEQDMCTFLLDAVVHLPDDETRPSQQQQQEQKRTSPEQFRGPIHDLEQAYRELPGEPLTKEHPAYKEWFVPKVPDYDKVTLSDEQRKQLMLDPQLDWVSRQVDVSPHVFELMLHDSERGKYKDKFKSQQRSERFFRAAWDITEDDSALVALAATCAENPQEQAKLYRVLAHVLVQVHEANSDLMSRWLNVQESNTVEMMISYDNDWVQGNNMLGSQKFNIQNREDYRNIPFNQEEQKYAHAWQTRVQELRRAVDAGTFTMYHHRWLETLSKTVDMRKVMEVVRSKGSFAQQLLDERRKRITFAEQVRIVTPENVRDSATLFCQNLRDRIQRDGKENGSNIEDPISGIAIRVYDRGRESVPNEWFHTGGFVDWGERNHLPLAYSVQDQHARLILTAPQRISADEWRIPIYDSMSQGESVITVEKNIQDFETFHQSFISTLEKDQTGKNYLVPSQNGNSQSLIPVDRIHLTTFNMWMKQFDIGFHGNRTAIEQMMKYSYDLTIPSDSGIPAELFAQRTQYDEKNCAALAFFAAALRASAKGDESFLREGHGVFKEHFGIQLPTAEQLRGTTSGPQILRLTSEQIAALPIQQTERTAEQLHTTNREASQRFIDGMDALKEQATQRDGGGGVFLLGGNSEHTIAYDANNWYEINRFLQTMKERYHIPLMIYNSGGHANLVLKLWQEGNTLKMFYWNPAQTGEQQGSLSYSPGVQAAEISLPNEAIRSAIVIGDSDTADTQKNQALQNVLLENGIHVTLPEGQNIQDFITGYDLTLSGDRALLLQEAKIQALQTDARNCVLISSLMGMMRAAAVYDAQKAQPAYLKDFSDRGIALFEADFLKGTDGKKDIKLLRRT